MATFDQAERSFWGGRPEELFLFQVLGGGPTYRYTSGRLPVSFAGFPFFPKALDRGNFTFKKDYSGNDTLELTVQSDLELLKHFKIIVPRRTMTLTIYRRHRGSADLDAVPVFIGRVRGVSWEGAKAIVSCDSMYAMAKRGGLNLSYQVSCNRFIYDAGCQLQKADWRLVGELEKVDGLNVYSLVFAQKPDGWWKYGFIETADGNYLVVDHVGNRVTLMHAMEGVKPGEFISIYAGCNRTLDQCWDKFNNGLNYLGFPWSPADNVFTDGL